MQHTEAMASFPSIHTNLNFVAPQFSDQTSLRKVLQIFWDYWAPHWAHWPHYFVYFTHHLPIPTRLSVLAMEDENHLEWEILLFVQHFMVLVKFITWIPWCFGDTETNTSFAQNVHSLPWKLCMKHISKNSPLPEYKLLDEIYKTDFQNIFLFQFSLK